MLSQTLKKMENLSSQSQIIIHSMYKYIGILYDKRFEFCCELISSKNIYIIQGVHSLDIIKLTLLSMLGLQYQLFAIS